jgi:hypothetical protein
MIATCTLKCLCSRDFPHVVDLFRVASGFLTSEPYGEISRFFPRLMAKKLLVKESKKCDYYSDLCFVVSLSSRILLLQASRHFSFIFFSSRLKQLNGFLRLETEQMFDKRLSGMGG